MDVVSKNKNRYLLRLDPGEELLSTIQDFCKDKNIKNAWLEGIGSSDLVVLAYYNLNKQEYLKNEYKERMEIMSILGNIAIKEGELFCHAHGVFGRPDMSTLGGHIVKCVVSATAEINLTTYSGPVERLKDEDTGLHLICS
ncbi:MAG: PPC domain-containing DNA-binding protein [Candidatus Spechtbacterales bacterium]|nr:PPC domain-containing DNA-binding protein [Candidatus Spechtbacterales bacterium]